MTQISAVYGFEFTQEFQAAELNFSPLISEHSAAKKLARMPDAYNITGTVSGENIGREVLHRLEGVLSFVERLDVRLSEPVADKAAIKQPQDFFESRVGGARNNGGGAVVGSDAFNPWKTSRKQFIELAMNKLADEDFCQKTKFDSFFFKSVETFRQRKPFLDISYFLLMSGLEAFARATLNDYASKNAATPITQLLQNYGFKIYQDRPGEIARAVSTYLHLRNALFHQGDFSKTIKIDNDQVVLNCSEYLFNLYMLVSLTIMKVIGFDDGHTNWECWIDRQMHRVSPGSA